MALGKCITQNYGKLGCKTDVLNILDGFCSGRNTCSVKGNNDALVTAKTAGCPKDMNAYLSAKYKCIKGNTLSKSNMYTNLKSVSSCQHAMPAKLQCNILTWSYLVYANLMITALKPSS